MNLAMSMWTLVVGAWILPPVVQPTTAPELPSYDQAAPRPQYEAPPRGSERLRSRFPGMGYGFGATSDYRTRGGGLGAQAGRPSRSPDRSMPLAPTNPLTDTTVPLASPTASPASEGPESLGLPPYPDLLELPPLGGRPTTGYPASRTRRPSNYRRPTLSRPGYRGTSSYAAHRANVFSTQNPQSSSAPSTGISPTKPFANYSPPPAISPYMDLFQNNAGALDNYNQFVRPRIQQNRANQAFGGQIGGLQRAARRQGAAIHQLNRIQGTIAPQYFMNYQDYFSGFGK
jgi:hypothetical protein